MAFLVHDKTSFAVLTIVFFKMEKPIFKRLNGFWHIILAFRAPSHTKQTALKTKLEKEDFKKLW